MKLKTFFQLTDKDCGIMSLSTMLYYYSKGNIYINDFDLNHEAYSLKELKDIALSYGLKTEGILLNDKTLSPVLEKSIVHLKFFDHNHFVFLYKIRKHKVILIDSNYGKISYSKNEFLKFFTGYALIFKSIEYTKNNFRKKYDYQRLKLLFLELIVHFPLFLIFLWVSEDSYIPLIFIFIYAFLMVLRKFILIFYMHRFDSFVEDILKDNHNLDENLIKKIYEFKESYFAFYPNLITFVFLNYVFFQYALSLKLGYLMFIIYLLLLSIKVFFDKVLCDKVYKVSMVSYTSRSNYEKYKKLNDFTNKFVNAREIFHLSLYLIFSLIIGIFNYFIFNNLFISISLLLFGIYVLSQDKTNYFNNNIKKYEVGKVLITTLTSNKK